MMKEQDFIAHVRVEEDAFRIQTVKEHSVGTATLSESFASVFGAAAWGKQNGWWHDMGKYTKNSFQPYIRNASGMAVEHIIRKTKCFDFWERNVLFPKTKRSFFRTPTLPFSA
ncbi:hypothetical protein [Parabacteroides merdae]|uniref:hypothetical protein n=1 Tax=Parabacteroides merdae TaxID=46503 RepID=UPI0034A52D9D